MELLLSGLTFPIVDTLSVLTVVCQLLSSVLIALLTVESLGKKPRHKAVRWIGTHSLHLMFAVALTATLGSLFFSEIAMWAPCKLCWFQRIFMYPQVLLLGYALWRQDTRIVPYVLILCLVGISVSIFHYFEQVQSILDPIGHDSSAPCDLSGVSCRATYIWQFGYISIPMLAMTAFLCNTLTSLTMLTQNTHTASAPQSGTQSNSAESAHKQRPNVIAGTALVASLIAIGLALTSNNNDAPPPISHGIEHSSTPSLDTIALTPKAELEEVQGVEGEYWTHAPWVPPRADRTEQKKVVVKWRATEMIDTLDPNLDLQYEFWGFEGKAPGPVLRVRQGDLVELQLTNDIASEHPHNIDFHFSTGPGGGAKALNVAPGETAIVHLRALQPGYFMYHCATPDIPTHIANGMYGGVIVDPAENPLPEVDHEFYIVQSEVYTNGASSGLAEFDLDALDAEHPTHVVFNGAVGSLLGENAPHVAVEDSVRLFVLNAGPQLISSFHVIGEIFDRVYREADFVSPPGIGIQSTTIPAGGASVVDFKIDVPGTYILVDHAIARAIHKGAVGTIIAEGPDNFEVFEAFTDNDAPDGHTAGHDHGGDEAGDTSDQQAAAPVGAAADDTEEVVVKILAGSYKKDDNFDNDYSPTTLTVKAGTTVTWVNEDRIVHTATAEDRSFNSGNLSKGQRWSYTFEEPGEYPYICLPHPWMKGTVIVEG